jgi:hypothetical protein
MDRLTIPYIAHGPIFFRNTPNNINRFGGVTTLQDNNKTKVIEI